MIITNTIRSAQAAICVFDVTNEESFHRISAWLKDLKSHANANVVVCIAGNKSDKAAAFNLDLCKQYAESVGAVYLPTSALTGDGVNEIFNKMAEQVVALRLENGTIKVNAEDNDLVKLTSKAKETRKSGCC